MTVNLWAFCAAFQSDLAYNGFQTVLDQRPHWDCVRFRPQGPKIFSLQTYFADGVGPLPWLSPWKRVWSLNPFRTVGDGTSPSRSQAHLSYYFQQKTHKNCCFFREHVPLQGIRTVTWIYARFQSLKMVPPESPSRGNQAKVLKVTCRRKQHCMGLPKIFVFHFSWHENKEVAWQLITFAMLQSQIPHSQRRKPTQRCYCQESLPQDTQSVKETFDPRNVHSRWAKMVHVWATLNPNKQEQIKPNHLFEFKKFWIRPTEQHSIL